MPSCGKGAEDYPKNSAPLQGKNATPSRPATTKQGKNTSTSAQQSRDTLDFIPVSSENSESSLPPIQTRIDNTNRNVNKIIWDP